MNGEPISRGQIAALAAPAAPMFGLMMPLAIFIPPFYADQMGLGLGVVGAIFTIGRLFDVVTDPIAGRLMDRTQHRVGRHVWVLVGAAPLALATWQIFFAEPPGHRIALIVWLLVFYTGWTLMSVGLFSWGAEVSADYDERSKVMGSIQFSTGIGMVLVVLLPVLVEFDRGAEQIELERVRAMGELVLVLLPLTLLISWFRAPRVQNATTDATPFLPAVRSAIRSSPVRRLLIVDLAGGIATGAFTALSVFFVEIVLGFPGRAGGLQLALMTSSLLGIPLWVRVAGRIEKHRTMSLVALIIALAGGLALILPTSSLWLAFVVYIAFGLGAGGTQMLPRAIMADLLDADRVASGEERAGLLFSLLSTTLKVGAATGVGLAFGTAAALGFDLEAARAGTENHWVVRLLIGGVPLAVGIMSSVLMWRFPFGRESQNSAREELALRAGVSADSMAGARSLEP